MDELEQKIWEGLGVSPDEPGQMEEPEQTEEELEEVDLQDQEDSEDTDEPEGEPEEEPEGGAPDADALRQQHDRELAQLRLQHQQQLDTHVAGLKLTNPYDGNKPITTMAEYQAYQQAHQQAQWESIRQQSGLTQQQLDELVAGLPQVQQAAQDAADEQALRQKLDQEIGEIRKFWPEVVDRESLVNHASWPQVSQKMRDTKCGVLDAFKAVNFDEYAKRSAENARRQTSRNQRGKDHLRGTGGKGKGGASIPADQLRIYQRLNPGASMSELQAFHAANNKA